MKVEKSIFSTVDPADVIVLPFSGSLKGMAEFPGNKEIKFPAPIASTERESSRKDRDTLLTRSEKSLLKPNKCQTAKYARINHCNKNPDWISLLECMIYAESPFNSVAQNRTQLELQFSLNLS